MNGKCIWNNLSLKLNGLVTLMDIVGRAAQIPLTPGNIVYEVAVVSKT